MSILLQSNKRRTLVRRNGVIVSARRGSPYLIRDDFADERAAGAVDGTPAVPGPSTRDVDDVPVKISIANGEQVVASAAGTSKKTYARILPRGEGLLVYFRIAAPTGQFGPQVGADSTAVPDTNPEAGWYMRNGVLRIGGTASDVHPYTSDTIDLVVILRTTGAQYFVGTDLVWVSDTGASTPLYMSENYDATIDAVLHSARAADAKYLSVPRVSDNFAVAPLAIDEGANGLDGAYNAASFADAETYFSGSAWIELQSSGLPAVLDGDTGTVIVRARVKDIGQWSAAGPFGLVRFDVDSQNRIRVQQSNAADDQILWLYRAGNVTKSVAKIGMTDTDYMTIGMTWDAAADEMRCYFNGAQEGSTQTGLGVWAGTTTTTRLGSSSAAWVGYCRDLIVSYGSAATPAAMASLHAKLVASALTVSDLDAALGATAWSHWKLDGPLTTNGGGHAEGASGSIGSGGDGLVWAGNLGAWLNSGGTVTAPLLIGGEAIATVEAGEQDVFVDLDITRSGGVAGMVVRYEDNDNYLRLTTDGVSAILTERVGGVENALFATAITYGAGDTMRLDLKGQSARVYYDGAFVNSTAVVDVSLTGTRVGLYTTDTGNALDGFVVHAATLHTPIGRYLSQQ